MENEQRKYWFFGSKLNSVLLIVLIVLMVIAIKQMYKNQEFYKQNIVVKDNTDSVLPGQAKYISLTDKDNHKSVTVGVGDVINITLNNPGDGGYTFENPEYDTSIFHLNNHTHIDPKTDNQMHPVVGNFGSDTWQFVAIKKGVTTITIDASQPWSKDSKINIFTTTATVQ